jgi:hypothetical protein
MNWTYVTVKDWNARATGVPYVALSKRSGRRGRQSEVTT